MFKHLQNDLDLSSHDILYLSKIVIIGLLGGGLINDEVRLTPDNICRSFLVKDKSLKTLQSSI